MGSVKWVPREAKGKINEETGMTPAGKKKRRAVYKPSGQVVKQQQTFCRQMMRPNISSEEPPVSCCTSLCNETSENRISRIADAAFVKLSEIRLIMRGVAPPVGRLVHY